MAKNILTNIDLNKNEIQNARIQNLDTEPTNPVKGQVYFNSSSNTLYIYNGSEWVAYVEKTATIAGLELNSDISVEDLKDALGVTNMAFVEALPDTPDENTLYFIYE